MSFEVNETEAEKLWDESRKTIRKMLDQVPRATVFPNLLAEDATTPAHNLLTEVITRYVRTPAEHAAISLIAPSAWRGNAVVSDLVTWATFGVTGRWELKYGRNPDKRSWLNEKDATPDQVEARLEQLKAVLEGYVEFYGAEYAKENNYNVDFRELNRENPATGEYTQRHVAQIEPRKFIPGTPDMFEGLIRSQAVIGALKGVIVAGMAGSEQAEDVKDEALAVLNESRIDLSVSNYFEAGDVLHMLGLRYQDFDDSPTGKEVVTKSARRRPKLDHIERAGPARRDGGRDVTTGELKDTFGLGSVVIGNYVNAADGQAHVNNMWDALSDLADLLGWKPADMGFGKRLTVAVGALGSGGNSAHFAWVHPVSDEAGKPTGEHRTVINLTATRGDGSLLHEYFHGIDYMLRQHQRAGVLGADVTARWPTTEPRRLHDLRQTREIEAVVSLMKISLPDQARIDGASFMGIENAIRGVRQAAESNSWNPYLPDSEFLLAAQTLSGTRHDEAYWNRVQELFARASEAWAYDTLGGKGLANNYLVSDWVAEGRVSADNGFKAAPYPAGVERRRFNTYFDELARHLSIDPASGYPVLDANFTLKLRKRATEEALENLENKRKETLDKQHEDNKAADERRREALGGFLPEEPVPPELRATGETDYLFRQRAARQAMTPAELALLETDLPDAEAARTTRLAAEAETRLAEAGEAADGFNDALWKTIGGKPWKKGVFNRVYFDIDNLNLLWQGAGLTKDAKFHYDRKNRKWYLDTTWPTKVRDILARELVELGLAHRDGLIHDPEALALDEQMSEDIKARFKKLAENLDVADPDSGLLELDLDSIELDDKTVKAGRGRTTSSPIPRPRPRRLDDAGQLLDDERQEFPAEEETPGGLRPDSKAKQALDEAFREGPAPALTDKTYATVRPTLQLAYDEAIADGKSVTDFAYDLVREYGQDIRPFVKRFLGEKQNEARARRDEMEVTEGEAFNPYLPPAWTAEAGAPAHPANIVEAAALAGIRAPEISYRPAIPEAMRPHFSDVQMAAIAAAGQSFRGRTPGGEARGFFIGDGCVAGETLIYDPVTGAHTAIQALAERGKPINVLSLTENGFETRPACAPFLKGTDSLYTFTLADGRKIKATQDHRFLTRRGWMRLIDGIEIGHYLAVDPTGRSRVREPGEHDSMDTAAGSPAHCSAHHRQYDAPLLSGGGTCPASPPLPAGAPGRSRCASHVDGPAYRFVRNGVYQSEVSRPTKSSFSPLLSRALSLISVRARAVPSRRLTRIRKSGLRFPDWSELLRHLTGAVLSRQPAPAAAGLSHCVNAAGRHAFSGDTRWPAPWRQRLSPSQLYSPPPGSGSQYQANPAQRFQPVPSSLLNHTGWARIVSIEFCRHDNFYDMHVPGPENYVVDGIVNHNTGVGKAREILGIILDRRAQGEGRAVVMSKNTTLYAQLVDEYTKVAGVTEKQRQSLDPAPVHREPGALGQIDGYRHRARRRAVRHLLGAGTEGVCGRRPAQYPQGRANPALAVQ